MVLGTLGVNAGEKHESLSVPSQQVGYLVRECSVSFTEEDWSVLQGVYSNAQELGETYVPYRADNIKNKWIDNAPGENKWAFVWWYLKQYASHPRQMVLAVLALDYPVLCVDTSLLEDESYLTIRDNLPAVGLTYSNGAANFRTSN